MTLQVEMGCQGDRLRIGVHWFDHNNVRRLTVVEIAIGEQDKPRTLTVAAHTVHEPAPHPDEMLVREVYAYRS